MPRSREENEKEWSQQLQEVVNAVDVVVDYFLSFVEDCSLYFFSEAVLGIMEIDNKENSFNKKIASIQAK